MLHRVVRKRKPCINLQMRVQHVPFKKINFWIIPTKLNSQWSNIKHAMKTVWFFCLLLLVVSCKKYKKPTAVSFIAQQTEESVLQGKIQINSGTFRIVEFEFEGQRKRGDDVEIEREWSDGVPLILNQTSALSEFQFQIPQGVFNTYNLELEVDEKNNEPAIELCGAYTNSSSQLIPFKFRVNEKQVFELKGKDIEGQEMVLDADNPTTSIIRFDIAYWFDVLSISQLENADLEYMDGEYVLLIDKNHNENLYDLIINRLNKTDELYLHP